MRRPGFTLIELLVVIAVIAVLAGLLFAGANMAITAAKSMATTKRVSDVATALLLPAEGAGAAYVLQRDGLGDDLSFTTLDRVMGNLLANAPNGWPAGGQGIADGYCPPHVAYTSWNQGSSNRTAIWGGEGSGGWFMIIPTPGYENGAVASRSSAGESPQVQEVNPDAKAFKAANGGSLPAKTWYRARWPMQERRTGTTKTLTGGWPGDRNEPADAALGWDNATPGSIVATAATPTPGGWVRWASAWGRPPLDPLTASVAGTPVARDLGQLSPLHTITLLQTAGVLAAGQAGIDAYRSDRGTNRAWNDRWGNPLVVVSAAFVPLRHDLIYSNAIGGWVPGSKEPRFIGDIVPSENRSLVRPRDALIQLAGSSYGFQRAVYAAVAAVGPRRAWPAAQAGDMGSLATAGLSGAWNGDRPLPAWDAGDDGRVVRGLWLQARAITKAADWAAQGFVAPPWTGVRMLTGSSKAERGFVSAPVEVK